MPVPAHHCADEDKNVLVPCESRQSIPTAAFSHKSPRSPEYLSAVLTVSSSGWRPITPFLGVMTPVSRWRRVFGIRKGRETSPQKRPDFSSPLCPWARGFSYTFLPPGGSVCFPSLGILPGTLYTGQYRSATHQLNMVIPLPLQNLVYDLVLPRLRTFCGGAAYVPHRAHLSEKIITFSNLTGAHSRHIVARGSCLVASSDVQIPHSLVPNCRKLDVAYRFLYKRYLGVKFYLYHQLHLRPPWVPCLSLPAFCRVFF